MGTDIEAAAIAAALGAFADRTPGVRSPMPGSASRERWWASSRQGGGPRRPAGRQGGSARGVRPPLGPRRDSLWPARTSRGRRSGALSALRGGRHRYPRDLGCRGMADGQVACLERSCSCRQRILLRERVRASESVHVYCCAPSRATAVWEGQALSRLPRPTDHDGGGDSD